MARKHDPWTDEEDGFIRLFFPVVGSVWRGWGKLMPERMPSPNNICQQAHRLHVRCNHRFQYGKGREQAQMEADAMPADYLLYTGKTVDL